MSTAVPKADIPTAHQGNDCEARNQSKLLPLLFTKKAPYSTMARLMPMTMTQSSTVMNRFPWDPRAGMQGQVRSGMVASAAWPETELQRQRLTRNEHVPLSAAVHPLPPNLTDEPSACQPPRCIVGK